MLYTMEKETVKHKTKRNKKKHVGLKIFILIVIIIGIIIGIFAKKVNDLDGNWLAVLLGHNKETIKNLDKLNILLMGESQGMSDTIIVASYDPKEQKAALLSIPRDTYIGTNKSKTTTSDKINSLYNDGRDAKKTMEAVNRLTGLNVQYYIVIDTEGLRELVNTIDGLEFDVPIDMKYKDDAQDLNIDLKAGLQHLNGEQVEQLVRFRHNQNGTSYSYSYGNEDFGRMRTQREVMVAIVEQTLQFKNVTEIGNILDIAEKYVDTNLDFKALKDYIPYIKDLDTETIRAEQLPGVADYLGYLSFFLYDEEEGQKLINEMFYGITQEETTENEETQEESELVNNIVE